MVVGCGERHRACRSRAPREASRFHGCHCQSSCAELKKFPAIHSVVLLRSAATIAIVRMAKRAAITSEVMDSANRQVKLWLYHEKRGKSGQGDNTNEPARRASSPMASNAPHEPAGFVA